MNNQEKPNAQQSLDLIHEMITQAKGDIGQKSSFYFLLWGWVILAGSIGHFFLLEFTLVAHPEWAWIVILLGIAGSFANGISDRENRASSTYASRLYRMTWLTFLVNYVIVLIFLSQVNSFINPVILLMAGSATYLSGLIIRFRPLKWGALFIWVMAIVAFLVPLPYQLLASAAAVLVGYLIPGYMLKKSEV